MQKIVDNVITDYVYSGNYLIEETGKTYLRGLSYHAVEQDGNNFYYFANAHGDITNVVNGASVTVAGYDYDEFGNLTEQTGNFANSVRYAGEFYDSESENYYLRSRYYDPSIGRFTQQDTFLGVDSNPLSLNRYTYCHNNPIRYIDPSGHYTTSVGGHEVIVPNNLSSQQQMLINSELMSLGYGEITLEEFLNNAASYNVSIGVNINGGEISPYDPSTGAYNEDIAFKGAILSSQGYISYGTTNVSEQNAYNAFSGVQAYYNGYMDNKRISQYLLDNGFGLSVDDILLYEMYSIATSINSENCVTGTIVDDTIVYASPGIPTNFVAALNKNSKSNGLSKGAQLLPDPRSTAEYKIAEIWGNFAIPMVAFYDSVSSIRKPFGGNEVWNPRDFTYTSTYYNRLESSVNRKKGTKIILKIADYVKTLSDTWQDFGNSPDPITAATTFAVGTFSCFFPDIINANIDEPCFSFIYTANEDFFDERIELAKNNLNAIVNSPINYVIDRKTYRTGYYINEIVREYNNRLNGLLNELDKAIKQGIVEQKNVSLYNTAKFYLQTVINYNKEDETPETLRKKYLQHE